MQNICKEMGKIVENERSLEQKNRNTLSQEKCKPNQWSRCMIYSLEHSVISTTETEQIMSKSYKTMQFRTPQFCNHINSIVGHNNIYEKRSLAA